MTTCSVCGGVLASLGTDPGNPSVALVTCGSRDPRCVVGAPVYRVVIEERVARQHVGRARLTLTPAERATRRKEQIRASRRAHYRKCGR